MKTMKYLSLRIIAVLVIAIGFALPSKAQTLGNYYANIDWQFNFPLGNDFVKRGSGWCKLLARPLGYHRAVSYHILLKVKSSGGTVRNPPHPERPMVAWGVLFFKLLKGERKICFR